MPSQQKRQLQLESEQQCRRRRHHPSCSFQRLLRVLAERTRIAYNILDKFFPFVPSFSDLVFDVPVDHWFEIIQTEVFQAGFDPLNAHSTGKGCIDILGFRCDQPLFFRWLETQGTHIMQTVSQFDENDTNIG